MAESPQFTLKIAETPSEIQSIRELFTAYVASLNLDLSFQDYSNELSSLPGKYGPDLKGVLLLAVSAQNVAIGCVCLRSLDSENKVCEMKRLYCLPETRGMGVGKALVDVVLKRAKELGYSEMRLDTLPQMIVPRKIYRERGFEEIPAYYDTPFENTIFLAKKL